MVYRFQLQANIWKRPLTQILSIWITKAGFVVKIHFFAGIAISDPFASASGFAHGQIFLRQVLKRI
jgi:hypothetical protein